MPTDDNAENAGSRRSQSTGCVIAGLAVFGIGVVIALLLPAQQNGPPSKRSICKNSLKQIGMALQSYHDMYTRYPPAIVADANGRPMHSWRVLLLPFIDQHGLYNSYRFDEPWDGPNNSRLHSVELPVYRCPGDEAQPGTPEARTTSYLAIVGPETAWHSNRGARARDVTDGPGETLHVVEVANSGIHWMEPRDLHVTQMAPTINARSGQGISSRHKGGANVLFADGTVKFLEDGQSREELRAQVTIRGGETILGEQKQP